MSRMPPHDCPGCGRAGIPYARLSCKPCWYRLPRELRDRILGLWQARKVFGSLDQMDAHAAAVAEAVEWYETHPVLSGT